MVASASPSLFSTGKTMKNRRLVQKLLGEHFEDMSGAGSKITARIAEGVGFVAT
jgi:hypothetical protein